MQGVLRKRVFRSLKKHFIRYAMLGIMVAMGIFLVVTIVGSGETLTRGTESLAEETRLEDGEFEVFVPLSDKQEKEINDMGVELERQFYYDYELDDPDMGTVRMFKVRDHINQLHYIEGNNPLDVNEVVLEKRYAEVHELNKGDVINIAGKDYKISGIAVVSDYDGPFKEISDTSCNSKSFGLVFFDSEEYDNFKNSGKAQKSETYLYTYKLGGKTTDKDLKKYLKDIKIEASQVDDELFQEYWDRTAGIKDELTDAVDKLKDATDDVNDAVTELAKYYEGLAELADGTSDMYDGVNELDDAVTDALEEYDFELSNLTSFLVRADNPRIFATKNDKIVDIEVGIVEGIILLILLAYVISVFVVHSIESESSIIGTLYSMGVTKNDLLLHYVTLPVVVTFIAGLIGLLVASTGVMAPMIAESSYQYFSIPVFEFNVPTYLIFYSLICPPVMAVIVNVLVISSKLNRPALSLIRNEAKQGNIKKVNLKSKNFIFVFRIRQMLRELRSTLAVVLGMFLSLLIFMMAVNCYTLCENIAKDYANDTKFEYFYTLKYPEKEPPKGAEAAYAYTCKKETMGFNFDVTILGIDDDNKYFDIKTTDSKVDVVISSAFAEKFGLKEGDEFVVSDEEKELKYAFSVYEITSYSSGFYIFMDIDEMRDMMGESKDYYNVLISDKKLKIDGGRLYSITTRDDIVKGSEVFTELMMPMIYTLSFASAVIFCVVLYLMMKVMIDRSAQNISLIKVFGYRRKEIRKLYLDGNFYIIALGTLIVLPLSKVIINKIFPFMISNVSCGLNVKTPYEFYIVTYFVILALYFLINSFLVRRLDKFSPAEILKNRE